ncbi:MAG: hypothetical protein HY055_17775 [Magnetospirillum sp.]|nr:hypothetical protein [Magnetospirillum sp.]
MRRSLFVSAFLLSLLGAATAGAKPKGCFTLPELKAEQEIRHGIYLREAANRCDARFLPGAKARWQKIEAANGVKFKAANAKRIKAWEREFPDDWKYKLTFADGRLVTYDRNIPLTSGFCDNIDDLLTTAEKGGYGALTKQIKPIRNEVVEDYKACQ